MDEPMHFGGGPGRPPVGWAHEVRRPASPCREIPPGRRDRPAPRIRQGPSRYRPCRGLIGAFAYARDWKARPRGGASRRSQVAFARGSASGPPARPVPKPPAGGETNCESVWHDHARGRRTLSHLLLRLWDRLALGILGCGATRAYTDSSSGLSEEPRFCLAISTLRRPALPW